MLKLPGVKHELYWSITKLMQIHYPRQCVKSEFVSPKSEGAIYWPHFISALFSYVLALSEHLVKQCNSLLLKGAVSVITAHLYIIEISFQDCQEATWYTLLAILSQLIITTRIRERCQAQKSTKNRFDNIATVLTCLSSWSSVCT